MMRRQKRRNTTYFLITSAAMVILILSSLWSRQNWPVASLIIPARNTSFRSGSRTIPLIIHQTWKSFKIPTLFRPWIQNCIQRNPHFEYWFWTDQDIWDFMGTNHRWFYDLFEGYPDDIQRVDAFRYFVLHDYGGVYIDLDMDCLRDIKNVLQGHSCIMSQEPPEHAHFHVPVRGPLVSNALMASVPNHPFFRQLIHSLPRHAGVIFWNDVMHATGPLFLTSEYTRYIKQANDQYTEKVYLAPAKTFHPTLDNSRLEKLKQRCRTKLFGPFQEEEFLHEQMRLCEHLLDKNYQNVPDSSSYTDHQWAHSWAGKDNDPYDLGNTVFYFNLISHLKKLKLIL